MPNTIVLGAQWGDEGKGKVTDLLAARMDAVVRFQGGANAGHTVVVGDTKYVLHLLPSGILNPATVNVIANGCVVDPIALAAEIAHLGERGITVTPQNLRLSHAAHVVTPFHRHADRLAGGAVGTTGRGIGPAYEDKVRRTGLRLEHLADGTWRDRLKALLSLWQTAVPAPPDAPYPTLDEAVAALAPAAEMLAPFVINTRDVIADLVRRDRAVLFEGAQGTLLDVDHGTYPFVTSSSTTIGGALTGTGVYLEFTTRLAVVKAYTTRVGHGPFPTELTDETGRTLQRRGAEFGATTGRPRRCGWLDLHLLRESVVTNGFNGIALTKLDCLTGLGPLRVAVGRDSAGAPVYRELAGFDGDLAAVTRRTELPRACAEYIRFIEDFLGVPVVLVSTGPARHETLVADGPRLA